MSHLLEAEILRQNLGCTAESQEDMDQCLSQDLESGCLKLAVVKYLGIHIFKGYHNILIF